MKTTFVNNLVNFKSGSSDEKIVTTKNENNVEQDDIQINYTDRGLIYAGRSYGDPIALENSLNKIKAEHFMEENKNEEKKLLEKEKINTQILELQENIIKLKSENDKITGSEIPNIQISINAINDEINEIRIETEQNTRGDTHVSKFDLILYLSILIPATFFLIAFYASAFHSGFYRDIISDAQKAGASNINSVFNLIFNLQAFKELNLHWLSPIIFFVFGLILHNSFDSKGWLKPIKLIITLVFILMSDGLLAYFIENKTHQLKVIMGLAESNYHFYYSPVFYMVLVLGYFTCLGWSIILYQIRKEIKKLDYKANAKLSLKIKKEQKLLYEKDIHTLQGTIMEKKAIISTYYQQIENLRKKSECVLISISDLEKKVTDFYDGWLKYVLIMSNYKQILTECEIVKKKFYEVNIVNKANSQIFI